MSDLLKPKRYSPANAMIDGTDDVCMEQDEHGEWVAWADVQELIQEIEELRLYEREHRMRSGFHGMPNDSGAK